MDALTIRTEVSAFLREFGDLPNVAELRRLVLGGRVSWADAYVLAQRALTEGLAR